MKRRILALAAVAALATGAVAGSASAATYESADVGVAISADKAAVKAGDLVTYTVTVTNAGAAAAEGVTVADLLPATMQLVSATGIPSWWEDGATATASTVTSADQYADPTGSDAGPYVGRTLVSFAVGHLGSAAYGDATDTATVQIVAVATKAGATVNEVQVGALNPDPNVAANNYAWSTVAVS